jgi:hypothetical protein
MCLSVVGDLFLYESLAWFFADRVLLAKRRVVFCGCVRGAIKSVARLGTLYSVFNPTKPTMPLVDVTYSYVGRPIVATAVAISDFLRRALWRRRRSLSDHSSDSLVGVNRIIGAGSLKLDLDQQAEFAPADGSDLAGHSDALPPAQFELDEFSAELVAEVLDLDPEAIMAGLHQLGLRARMLEPSSKKFGRLVTMSYRNWYAVCRFLFQRIT